MRVVDPGDGHEIQRLTGAPWLTSNRAVAQSPDGSVLVTAGRRGVVGWDLDRRRVRWVADVDGDNCSTVVVEPTSGRALCGGRFSRVIALDLDTGRQSPSGLDMQHGEISGLLLTPDGTLVQLSRTENLIARWRLDGLGPITRRVPTGATPTGYNADGSLLLTSGPAMRTAANSPSWLELTAVSAASGEVVWRGGDHVTAAWTSHPDRLVAWTSDGRGVVIDVRGGRVVRSLEGDIYGYPPDGTSAPPGGHHLLGWSEAYDNDESAWAVWDLRTGAQVLLRTLPVGGDGSLTRDGRLLVRVQGADDLAAYDVADPDAAVDGPLVRRPDVVAAAVSPTGLVAASRPDGRLGFHRARTLQPVGPPLPQTPGQVEQLAFSRDGRLLAARSTTGEVRLFDTGARTQLGEAIELGLDRTRSIALRPDGRALAVRTDDGIHVWDLLPAHWSREVCTLVGRSLTREEWATYLQPVGAYRPSCV